MSKKEKKYKQLDTLPTSKFTKTPSILPSTKTKSLKVVFSFEKFKCVSVKNKIFNNCFTSLWEYGVWSLKLLDRISSLCTMTTQELKGGGDSTRCHPVIGGRLDKLKSVLDAAGVLLDEQLEDFDYYELSLGTTEGRIFGYFIDNTYYILLFDPNHLIYENISMGAQHDLLYKNCDPWKSI